MVDAIPDSIMVFDRGYRLVLVNQAATRANGVSDPVARGLRCHEFSHHRATPCDGASDPCPLSIILQTRRPTSTVHVHYTSSGEDRIVELNSAPILDQDGQVSLVVEVGRDITERVRAEEQQRRLALALERAPDMVVMTDPRGLITYVNPAMQTCTGYSRAELIGANVSTLKSGEHDAAFYTGMWEAITRGEVWRGRVRNRRKDGSTYLADINISPVLDAQGAVQHYVSIQRDVTREVEMERLLTQASKLESVGRLAAGIAHEINTPAQYVGDGLYFLNDAFCDLLDAVEAMRGLIRSDAACQQHAGNQDKLDEISRASDLEYLVQNIPDTVARSQEGLRRIAKIVSAMKEFGHPGTGRKEPADLNRAVENTLEVARNEYKHVAEVATELGELPQVECEIAAIKQVLLNLVVNAAHAMRDKVEREGRMGRLTLRTRVEGEVVILRVTDTGSGILPEHLPRLFDPFFTTKPLGQGTGQGLAIARNIVVDQHGGELSVESTPGQGTTFVVRLPLVAGTMRNAGRGGHLSSRNEAVGAE